MSAPLLAYLQQAQVFRPDPDYAQLAAVHLPYDDLTGRRRTEAIVRQAAAAGRPVAVVGERGSGKSSVLAYALTGDGGLPDGFAPYAVPFRGERLEVVTDLHRFLRLLVTRMCKDAGIVVDEARRRGALAASGEIQQSRLDHELGARLGLPAWLLDVGLSYGITQGANTFTETFGDDALAAANDLLDALREAGRAPYLVLDDSDALLRTLGSDRLAAAAGFFDAVLEPLLQGLECGVAVAVQPEYETLAGWDAMRDRFEAVVHVPALPAPAETVPRILARRLERRGASLAVFEPGAVERLARYYQMRGRVRTLLRVATVALGWAVADRRDRQAVEEDAQR